MTKETLISVKTHFLYPSAIFASREPYLVSTILGSCVSVCMWDKITGMGGINHYMLPLWNGQGLASPKYGNIAIVKLIDKMKSFGSRSENLTAKIFGGGEVIQAHSIHYNIGQRNIDLARSMLAELNIPIIASNTGGKAGRKILFNTQTGEVQHKFINAQ